MTDLKTHLLAVLLALAAYAPRLHASDINQHHMNMESPSPGEARDELLLPDEINGVSAEHVALTGPITRKEALSAEEDTVFLFIKGNGALRAGETHKAIDSESIALPIAYEEVRVEVSTGDTLHYLRITKALSPEDLIEAKQLAPRNSSDLYFKKFSECQAYTEKIKSPKTVSRTVLPKDHAPRIAMGTVETTGPDAVGAHEHPMLDQLFLGLETNDSLVFADSAQTRFPEFSLLHIPLGSSHWVEVEEGNRMYYMWMDFFLTKEGLDWLKTHKHVEPASTTSSQD